METRTTTVPVSTLDQDKRYNPNLGTLVCASSSSSSSPVKRHQARAAKLSNMNVMLVVLTSSPIISVHPAGLAAAVLCSGGHVLFLDISKVPIL